MKAILKIQTAQATNEISIDLNQSLVFGRTEKANYKIPDALMSGSHCQLTLSANKLDVRDLDSKNGTYLNGVRIEKAEFYIGDELKIGETRISLAKEKMEPNVVQALSFKGDLKNRMSNELRLDMSDSKRMNPLRTYGSGINTTTMSEKKSAARAEKITTKAKLSKYQIKQKNKARGSLASTIDVLSIFLMAAIPLLIINVVMLFAPDSMQSQKFSIVIGLEVFFVGSFYYYNTKVAKFSLGEKLSGIQKLYTEQD